MRAGSSLSTSPPPTISSITMKWQAKPNLLIKNRILSVVISQWRAATIISSSSLKEGAPALIRPTSRRRKMTKPALHRTPKPPPQSPSQPPSRQGQRVGARRHHLLRLRILVVPQIRLMLPEGQDHLVELLLQPPEICRNPSRPLLDMLQVNLPSKTPLPPKRRRITRKRVVAEREGTMVEGPAPALQIIKACQI